jgi:plastocyanin
MDTLDSRSLKIGDCVAIKFAAVGPVRCLLSTAAHARTQVSADEGFPIDVKAKSDPAAPGKQYTIMVKKDGNQLVPHTKELSIQAGDTVLWHTTDPTITGFAVGGSGKAFAFSSHGLQAEAIYTHAFGLPGTYEWADPLAGKISGVVVVKPVTPKNEAERQAWLDSLSQGAAFEIRGGKVTPQKVEIVVGQTVFWKVWDGAGIAIVDKRLIAPKQAEPGLRP